MTLGVLASALVRRNLLLTLTLDATTNASTATLPATSQTSRIADQKKTCLPALKREAAKLNGETISIANSSDPYPRAEATEGLTRRCLEILSESNCKIQIITKSNIVARDDDLLSKVPSTVALTITTDDDNLAKLIEPYAPPPSQRLRAAQDLIKAGIPVSVRIDPIIPFVNDQPQKLIADLGKHRRQTLNMLNVQG